MCRQGVKISVPAGVFVTMSRMTIFSSPFLLGFDEIERLLERASKSAGDGYPPYNIERLPTGEAGGEKLRIVLAVAGFSPDDLEIRVEDNQLIIRGKQADQGSDYLHRGIAARQFQRTFVLAEGIEVVGASMENGLLAVELVRPQPQKLVRKIEIHRR
jgi:HSP20 family molecular chaperone IbpA